MKTKLKVQGSKCEAILTFELSAFSFELFEESDEDEVKH
jgi:hypothetical protein